jgi:hypothetical protein
VISNALTLTGLKSGHVDQGNQLSAKFTDQASISSWAKASVAQSANAGIIEGMGDGTFAPSEFATRAQAAVMLKRFLHYVRFID